MKHIKKYNESVSQDIIQNINDILINLKDDGYAINVYTHYPFSDHEILVNISKRDRKGTYLPALMFNELIEEDILTLINYMKSESYDYKIETLKGPLNLKEYKDKIYELGKLPTFVIKFKKSK